MDKQSNQNPADAAALAIVGGIDDMGGFPLLRPSGPSGLIVPAGDRLTLAEMQAAVGGYVEAVPLAERYQQGGERLVMLVDEDGRGKGLDLNPLATLLVESAIWIVGPALVIPVGELA